MKKHKEMALKNRKSKAMVAHATLRTGDAYLVHVSERLLHRPRHYQDDKQDADGEDEARYLLPIGGLEAMMCSTGKVNQSFSI